MAPKVAVVGAGPLGLLSLKTFLEDGFEATAFESRSFIGGIWQPCDDENLSVAQSTIFNSSRFRSALSDFPFPDDTDDYPTWQQMHKYLESYADHFALRDHIRLNSKVTDLKRAQDKWLLEITPTTSGQPTIEEFDKICVATGTFVQPKVPPVDGIQNFQGRTLHTINFTNQEQFRGQNVLLIGIHASAQDVAVCLENAHAKHVYASHRGGVVMIPRYMKSGATTDVSQNFPSLIFQIFMTSNFPNLFNWVIDKLVGYISAKALPLDPSWNLGGGPSLAVTTPLMGDEIYALMKSGFVEPVAGVKRVTGPKSIELTNGHVLEDIDSIIYCTGYDACVPFLPAEFNPYPVVGEVPHLFRNVFPLHPDSAVRESLAFVGHAGLPFPGFVQHELLAMAISQTWLGRVSLPPLDEMMRWRAETSANRQKLLAKQKVHSTSYVFFVPFAEHICWLDEAAGTGLLKRYGWLKPEAWKLWWNDNELWKKMKYGVFSPAMWRIFDEGRRKPWSGARAQLFIDDEIVERRKKEYLARKEAGDKANGHANGLAHGIAKKND